MDEGILIEIAQRFRALEDLTEEADLYHVERMARAEETMQSSEDCGESHNDGGTCPGCAEFMKAKCEFENIEKLRSDLDKALEACRDDMVAMSECIRKARE